MKFEKVKSSQIKEIGYDKKNQTIHVKFNYKDKMFLYFPFDEKEYKEFIEADSVGKHFNAHIRKYVVIEDEVQECKSCSGLFYIDRMFAEGDEDWFCLSCKQELN